MQTNAVEEMVAEPEEATENQSEGIKNTVQDINISDIIILDRKRDIVEARVAVLEDSIDELGLLQPIVITPDFILVVGRHRLEVFKRKGYETIPATVKQYNDVDAELAEIDENLVRFELSSMERSMQYARRQELYNKKHPKTAAQIKEETEAAELEDGEDGQENPGVRGSADEKPSKTFVHDTAEKTGRSTTQVRDEANLGKALLEKLTPEVRGLIAPTKAADNKKDLQRLVDEPDRDVQLEAAQMVNEAYVGGGNLSVAEALRQLSGETSFESTVSSNGEATLHTALKKNLRILEMAVNTPNFKTNAETWTVEGLMEIREEFYRIERLSQRGAVLLSDVIEAKEKLGQT